MSPLFDRPAVRSLRGSAYRDPGPALADWVLSGDRLSLTLWNTRFWQQHRRYHAVMGGRASWRLDGVDYQQQKVTVLPGLKLVSVLARRVQR
jgi:hypothetical protein